AIKTLFSVEEQQDVVLMSRLSNEVIEMFELQDSSFWLAHNFLPTSANRRFRKLIKRLDEYIYGIIGNHRKNSEDTGDLLSMLLEDKDEDVSQMTDQQLRDEVMTLFLAGHETTALALSWTWYLLSEHPEAEQQFHAELDDVLGGRAPTVSDLPRLKYTEMLAKESMRLYPPAYAVGREALEETEVGGYRVPKGTQLFAFQWVTQRDPRYFDGPDAFKPERWNGETGEQVPKYAYFPFGGGPRQCIGNYFAMMEIVLLLATIGQRFKFKLDPDHKVEVLPVLSLRPKNGIKVMIEPA